MNGENIGTVYLCIHRKLKEYSKTRELNQKWVISFLAKCYHIPKPLGNVVLKELEKFELIKTNSGLPGLKEIEVVNCNTEIDTPSVIYNKVGLF